MEAILLLLRWARRRLLVLWLAAADIHGAIVFEVPSRRPWDGKAVDAFKVRRKLRVLVHQSQQALVHVNLHVF